MRNLTLTRDVRPLILLAFALAAFILLPARTAHALEKMRSFEAVYEVQRDGSIIVTERIEWDFEQEVDRHGIFRDLVVKQDCPGELPEEEDPDLVRVYPCKPGFEREYPVEVLSVVDGNGNPWEYKVMNEGNRKRIRIGDPDKTVQGLQVYVITYRLERALDAYPNHDELYWNATGHDWLVSIESARIEVRVPGSPPLEAVCYEGSAGSTRPCETTVENGVARFEATTSLHWGYGMTVAVAMPKGTVDVPPPLLHDKPSIDDYFELDAFEIGGAAVGGVAAVGAVAGLWWRHGRDRAYKTIHYLTNDPEEHTRPLFSEPQVVVEFLPPDGLKPAQMGVIIDEKADTVDVTATIIDLAVRGHLHITEIEKKGWRAKPDWQLDRRENPADKLLPYEQLLLDQLFGRKESVKLSSLKGSFAPKLKKVKDALYDDAMQRHWFTWKPETRRGFWVAVGFGVIVIGALLTVAAGVTVGRALLGAPVVLAGILLLAVAPAMKRRTAQGSEALRRVLGFRKYIVTAETRRQEFNEQRNIFAEYLPYAIVFGAVEKWAKAFEGLADEELAETTALWYTGRGAFTASVFSRQMHSFSDTVSMSLSTAPSSGGSGFSGGGGYSGGGGGGGGGGSW